MPRCRRYFTCCVRISREKAPHLFVDIVELLADRLSEIGVVPLLAGASGDAEYAAMLKVLFCFVLAECNGAYFEENRFVRRLGSVRVRQTQLLLTTLSAQVTWWRCCDKLA
jgi:hypothetical protein